MNRIITSLIILIIFGSTIFLIGRSFRVSKVPHGSKFSCNTCHTSGGGTPLNPFGLDVATRVTPNGTESFWSAELAALDSDGDGFTNGEELQDPSGSWLEGRSNPGDVNFVTNPGNANSLPTSVLDEKTKFTFQLFNNYPNPFNPSTLIKYEISNLSFVSLKVFDTIGNEVTTLVNDIKNAGSYEVQFKGIGLSSGIYYYRLEVSSSAEATSFTQTKKMNLIK